MSTLDLPLAAPGLAVAHLRRVSGHWVSGHYVVLVVMVVLLAWTSGLVAHTGEQARAHAARVEHQRQVAQRVHALAADWRIEQTFLDASRREALRARVAAIATERGTLAANRDAALANGTAVLAGSAGKVHAALRAQLAGAIGALAVPDTVYSRVAAATDEVTRRTGEVAEAEGAWHAKRTGGAAAADGAHQSATWAPPVAGSSTTGASVHQIGEATLRSLPGSAGVSIHWDDPDLGGHLGAVWSGTTSYMMVNGAALAGSPGKVRDVVRHEIAHIYQGRLATAYGLSWGELGARMSVAFGADPQEKAADCVALRFGASWTHYTSDCADADKQAWVDAMIGGYLP